MLGVVWPLGCRGQAVGGREAREEDVVVQVREAGGSEQGRSCGNTGLEQVVN